MYLWNVGRVHWSLYKEVHLAEPSYDTGCGLDLVCPCCKVFLTFLNTLAMDLMWHLAADQLLLLYICMKHLLSWKGTEMILLLFRHFRCWFKVISSKTHRYDSCYKHDYLCCELLLLVRWGDTDSTPKILCRVHWTYNWT